PFIEMPPVDKDEDYPQRVALALLEGLTSQDPRATWVMQSWPFAYQSSYWTDQRINDFMSGLPKGRVITLDLWAEARPQWSRIPMDGRQGWAWCALLNFGGRTDLVGSPTSLQAQWRRAARSATPPDAIGLSMEATHVAPMLFEFASDQNWQGAKDVKAWL